MSTIERVLVLVDPAMQITPALRRGVELARSARARLDLCLFDFHALIDATAELVHPDVMRLARAQFIEERMRWLADQAASLAGDGLAVECDVVWAPALHEAVIARVLQTRPSIVIKDVRHEAGLRRHGYTPADARLIRYCPVPLMLVHPGSAQLPRRVLAAVDTAAETAGAAELNAAIMRRALELGLYANAEVHLAHVFPYRPLFSAPYRKLESVYADIKQMHTEGFNAFARQHQVPAERIHWLEGEPAAALIDCAAQTGTDLIVSGSIYRSTLDRFFMGSTAEALLDRAPCDLLLVKPDDFAVQLASHLDLAGICRRHGVEPATAVPRAA